MTRPLTALVAALALAGCTAVAPPAKPVGQWNVDPLADPGGYHPPDLDHTRNYVAVLHVETDDSFDADALRLSAPSVRSLDALGFYVEPGRSASGQCEIYLRSFEVRPDNWRAVGAELQHEIDHCEYGHWHVGD